jgi:hypothetical protein
VPTADPRTIGWNVGTGYRYGLKLSTELAFGEQPDSFDFDLTGNATVVPVTATGTSATLFLTLGDAKITSRVADSQPQFDKLAAEIRKTGFFFGLSGGLTREVWLRHGTSPFAVTIYREIGSALQFGRVVPASNVYTVEEYDTTGKYVAEYRRDEGDTNWHKRKLRYLPLQRTSEEMPDFQLTIATEVRSSTGLVRLAPDGRPEAIDASEDLVVRGMKAPVHSKTSLALKATGAQPSDAATQLSAIMDTMDRLPVEQPYAPTEVGALDDARIHGLTFDVVLAGLEDLARGKVGGPPAGEPDAGQPPSADQGAKDPRLARESDLFEALAAIFRKHPETIPRAVLKIRGHSPAAPALIDALGSAGTMQAQDALVDLLKVSSDQVMRKRIMMALVRTPRPASRSIETLEAMIAQDPSNASALLGLGTYSRRLRDEGKPEQAEDLGKMILARLNPSQRSWDQVTVLDAIANSGYGGAMMAVVERLKNGPEEVRVAAASALRSMREPGVDDVLATTIGSDPSNKVRISAMDAARVREPTEVLTRAVAASASAAADPHVRYRAVELIIQWLPRRGDLRGALEQVAQHDEEVKIRDRAKSVL